MDGVPRPAIPPIRDCTRISVFSGQDSPMDNNSPPQRPRRRRRAHDDPSGWHGRLTRRRSPPAVSVWPRPKGERAAACPQTAVDHTPHSPPWSRPPLAAFAAIIAKLEATGGGIEPQAMTALSDARQAGQMDSGARRGMYPTGAVPCDVVGSLSPVLRVHEPK